MSWHRASICINCWEKEYPDITPHKIVVPLRQEETCCYCTGKNSDGIYVRANAKELHCQHDK